MRWVLIVLGIILVLFGIGWALQGANILPYGQMAGHRQWIFGGAGLDLVGIVLIVIGARIRRRATT